MKHLKMPVMVEMNYWMELLMRTGGDRTWSLGLATPQGHEYGSIRGQIQHVAEEISKQNVQRTTSDEPLTATPASDKGHVQSFFPG